MIITLVLSSINLYNNNKEEKGDKEDKRESQSHISGDLWVCSYPQDPSIISIKFEGDTFTALTKTKKVINGKYDKNVLYTVPDRKDVFTPYKYVPNDDSLIIVTLGGKNDVHIFNKEVSMKMKSTIDTYRGYIYQNSDFSNCINSASANNCKNFTCKQGDPQCFCMFKCSPSSDGNLVDHNFGGVDCSSFYSNEFINNANLLCKNIVGEGSVPIPI